MATVLDRFNHLGLAKNKSVLSWAGEHVANEFCKRNLHGRTTKWQEENGEMITVWDYPEDWIKEMDSIIIKMIDRGQTY